ncbi:LysR family transcriptional regulator [Phenylobacterium sp.]|uniref:LysR family transcriptional regulator n=1 Tax=Phenylobacterium sp. TaxID=1871053 RepID=UPI0027315C30|nr:LysR family transcriptional regulator [Phenylobacterium sp.]MDP1598792.1 LysR family transcriptional regulator [Phenylobacterium sp.]MDP3592062.1 LysR family transcriptional regulator [Phenylobacterium sp.]
MFENLTSLPLPSLNALRAFEAMARTGRATLAAQELNVTHSAVSRQVKALEEALGVRLFAGPKHRLELTQAGRELLPALTGAFDQIATAVRQIRGAGEDLHVAVNASVSVKWLIPRLSGFADAHPSVRLHLAELPSHATSYRGAHAVVRMVPTSRLADPDATSFIQSHLGLVMSPALAERFADNPLRAPRLSAQTHQQGWAIWGALAGMELPPAPEQPFAHLHFAIDAAIAGLGVAVMPWPLVADYVRSGRLVAPFGFRKAESAFALLAAPGVSSRALDQFRKWLVSEGAKTPPAPAYRPLKPVATR